MEQKRGGREMELKIFLTGDNHIGLKFSSYPDEIKRELIEARVNNLRSLIETANQRHCDLFIIAGDLFDKIKIAKIDIEKTAKILKEFSGTVAVMPGNHDYYDYEVDLWKEFQKHMGDNTLILNQWQPCNLKEKGQDLDVTLYPAYCNKKHSETNCLGWVKELELNQDNSSTWNIGIAHGSLQGLSPDLENKYFNMSEKELENIDLDLWLLGHTHIPYPHETQVKNRKVYNAGTPEPDGLDCRHGGNAWSITIDANKKVSAELVETGQYRFYDLQRSVIDEHSLEEIKGEILKDSPQRKIVRLNLSGRVDKELLGQLKQLYTELKNGLAHLEIREADLKLKITKQDIEKEYTKDSFPHQILNELLEEDEAALQLAYELIRGCKDAN